MRQYPPEVCEPCSSSAPDHWIADIWYYCEHNRVMVRRRKRTDSWTIDRNVKPKRAQKHFAAALALATAYMRTHGLDPAEVDAALNQLRTNVAKA